MSVPPLPADASGSGADTRQRRTGASAPRPSPVHNAASPPEPLIEIETLAELDARVMMHLAATVRRKKSSRTRRPNSPLSPPRRLSRNATPSESSSRGILDTMRSAVRRLVNPEVEQDKVPLVQGSRRSRSNRRTKKVLTVEESLRRMLITDRPDHVVLKDYAYSQLHYLHDSWRGVGWSSRLQLYRTGTRVSADARSFQLSYSTINKKDALDVFFNMFVGDTSSYRIDVDSLPVGCSSFDLMACVLGNFYNYMAFPFHFGQPQLSQHFITAMYTALSFLGEVKPKPGNIATLTYLEFFLLLPADLQAAFSGVTKMWRRIEDEPLRSARRLSRDKPNRGPFYLVVANVSNVLGCIRSALNDFVVRHFNKQSSAMRDECFGFMATNDEVYRRAVLNYPDDIADLMTEIANSPGFFSTHAPMWERSQIAELRKELVQRRNEQENVVPRPPADTPVTEAIPAFTGLGFLTHLDFKPIFG